MLRQNTHLLASPVICSKITDPAQRTTTAGEDLDYVDDLDRDRDVPDVYKRQVVQDL